MKSGERLARGWRLFRWARKVFITSFSAIAFLPLAGLFVLKIENASPLIEVGEDLFGVCVILSISSILWMMFWPCPRCKKPFAAKGFNWNPISDRCRHCGLPFGAKDDSYDKAPKG